MRESEHCPFCDGEMVYATPYITIRRMKKRAPFPWYTVEAKLEVKKEEDKRTVAFEFEYCPCCGREFEEKENR